MTIKIDIQAGILVKKIYVYTKKLHFCFSNIFAWKFELEVSQI